MEEWIVRAGKGDSEAFLKLIEGRMNVLYKIAFSYLKNKEDASDAVQDAVLIAQKNIRKLKDCTKFNSWITTILVNRCREILRKARRIHYEEYNEEAVGSFTQNTDQYSEVERSLDVESFLRKLDEKYREVITLKYFGSLSIMEIADVLGIPQGTVKSRLNFGLTKLREFMEVKSDGM